MLLLWLLATKSIKYIIGKDEPNPPLWLAVRVGKKEQYCLNWDCPFSFHNNKNDNKEKKNVDEFQEYILQQKVANTEVKT